jgi:hypothetical protein
LLGKLPFRFEIIIYADHDYFPGSVLVPGNVTVSVEKFLATEQDVIKSFLDKQVHACYLGLWTQAQMELYCRTSLSSKLATYAASGLPVIVDGPATSVAWSLVNKYGAGVLVGSRKEKNKSGTEIDVEKTSEEKLNELFCDVVEWRCKGEGSSRLRAQEFDFESQFSAFSKLLMGSSRGENILQR